LINKALSTHDSETWLNIFHAEDIPAGPVYNLNEAIEDPQIKHNKTVISLDHEKGGKVRLIGSPIKFPEIDQEQYSAPPTLGRHTHQVLSELLHYPEEKIRGLTKEQEDHYEELKKHYMRSL
jgi:formyl-CoA transferase/CoA:oxalate CoA-transferase